MWKELEYFKEYQKRLKGYLGEEKAKNVLNEALYLISVGTNDFLENYYTFPRRSSEFSVEDYQYFLAGIARDFVLELFQLGARKISLGALPPMGCLPLERARNVMFGSKCVEEYNNVAKSFNEKLKELVMKMNKEHEGIRLVLSNSYDILSEIIQKPQSFGKFSCRPTLYIYILGSQHLQVLFHHMKKKLNELKETGFNKGVGIVQR